MKIKRIALTLLSIVTMLPLSAIGSGAQDLQPAPTSPATDNLCVTLSLVRPIGARRRGRAGWL